MRIDHVKGEMLPRTCRDSIVQIFFLCEEKYSKKCNELAGTALSKFFLVEEKSLKSPPPPNANKKTHTGVTLGGFVIDCVGGKMLPRVSGTFFSSKSLHF